MVSGYGTTYRSNTKQLGAFSTLSTHQFKKINKKKIKINIKNNTNINKETTKICVSHLF